MLRLKKVTYLSPLLSIFYLQYWGSDALLFFEFLNIASILLYNFIKVIILSYNFLVISLSRYKYYMIWQISFCKFSDVLPDFTSVSVIGNIWSTSLGVYFFSRVDKTEEKSFSINWSIFSLRYNVRIIIKQFNNFFSWFVKTFKFFIVLFRSSDLYLPFTISFTL